MLSTKIFLQKTISTFQDKLCIVLQTFLAITFENIPTICVNKDFY